MAVFERVGLAAIACVLACTLSGCGVTRLTVNLDLYEEDPRFVTPLSAERAERLAQDVEELAAAGGSLLDDRTRLARDTFQVYSALWALLGMDKALPGETRSAIDHEADLLKEYVARLASKRPAFDKAVRFARREIAAYLEIHARVMGPKLPIPNPPPDPGDCVGQPGDATGACGDPAPSGGGGIPPNGDSTWSGTPASRPAPVQPLEVTAIELRVQEAKTLQAIAKLRHAYLVVADAEARPDPGRLDPAKLSGIFTPQIAEILVSRTSENERPELRRRYERLRVEAAALQKTVEALKEQRFGFPAIGMSSLPALGTEESWPATLSDSGSKLVQWLSKLPNVNSTDQARASLADIVRDTGLAFSQIDRLQDAGDPVWRVITDPDNRGLWNEQVSETYFRAVGNASVVIVRDAPHDFRVQRGTNNPAALIKGQLEVARSVTSAAITVAGAAYGVPPGAVSALTGSGESGPATIKEGDATARTAAESLARRKATADEAARIRKVALRSLDRTLSASASRVAGMTEGSDAYKQEIEHLKRMLGGYEKRFAPKSQGN